MTKIISQTLEYAYRNTKMSGHLVADAAVTGRRPGVLVVHEAFGLGAHAMASAERLARLGYVALAVDLWGERQQLSEMPKVMEAIQTLSSNAEEWTGRMEAARNALATHADVDEHRLAAVGYCFGGTTVLEYARAGGRLRGAAGLHSGLDLLGGEWSSAKTKAKLLVCIGNDDPMIPSTAVSTFQKNLAGSGVDWELDLYSGTKHSFTNPEIDKAGMPDVLAYNAQSDRRSWLRLQNFFRELFEEASSPADRREARSV